MATLPNPPGDLSPMDLFLGHQKLIEEITTHCCRRAHFKREEAEDFGSLVKIKLLEDDCAILRQYQGKSSLRTYLTVVIRRLLMDYQDHLWGKWRPSAEAVRLGPVAIRLERLIAREGYTLDEAIQILRINEKIEMSEAELRDLAAKLPPKPVRRHLGEEQLESEPSKEPRPDESFEENELEGVKRRVYVTLQRCLAALSKEDKLLVRMRMEYSVAQISRIRGIDQKPLYRRLDKIYKDLKTCLKKHGVRRQDIVEVFGSLNPKISDF